MEAKKDIKLEYHKVMHYPVERAVFNHPLEIDLKDLGLENIKISGRVSQNKNKKKKFGQDCISIARHNGFLLAMVCDGHGLGGLRYSNEVCELLPKLILGSTPENIFNDQYLTNIFEDCNRILDIRGSYMGEDGAVEIPAPESGSNEYKYHIAEIIEILDNEYVLSWKNPMTGNPTKTLPKEEVGIVKFMGGTTCACTIINLQNKMAKILTCGDSQTAVVLPSGVNELSSNVGLEKLVPEDFGVIGGSQLGSIYLSCAHTLQNEEEKNRIMLEVGDQPVAYKAGGDSSSYYLATDDSMVEPTRGIGDVNFEKVGYSHKPEISKNIQLGSGIVVCIGSDGIFFDAFEEEKRCSKTIELIGNEVIEYYGHKNISQLNENIFMKMMKFIYAVYKDAKDPMHDDMSLVCLEVS
eukprot:maker-scaffold_2-snap-gene-24.35-mRNA-1 protein AED:0.00 eAED:0.00 QI:238/1/1/1/1/1/5/109/408